MKPLLDMIRAHELLAARLDMQALRARAENLHQIEQPMGLRAWRRSAAFAAGQIEQAGAELETLDTPLDGASVFLDHIMPMGWDCESASLDLLSPTGAAERLADTETAPLCVGPFTPPTPAQGLVAELVPEDTWGSASWRGKFVFSARRPDGGPGVLRQRLSQSGALGALCAWSRLGQARPGDRQFINCFTASQGWYPPADEPPMILFSLSPGEAETVAARLARGPVAVRAVVKGVLAPAQLPIVSGRIPGQAPSEPEVLAVAHLYEPLPTDDATGASGAIEALAAILRAVHGDGLPPPRRTIRIVLMWEQYGLARYYTASRDAGRRMLALVNMDGTGQAVPGVKVEFVRSAASRPWGGDHPWLRMVHARFAAMMGGKYPVAVARGHYGDDCFLAHPAFGVPSLWVRNSSGAYHHSSALSWEFYDPDLARFTVAASAAFLHTMSCAGADEAGAWARGIAAEAPEAVAGALQRQGPAQAAFEARYHAARIASLRSLAPDNGSLEPALDELAAKTARLAPLSEPAPDPRPAMQYASRQTVSLAERESLPWDLARIPLAQRRPLPPSLKSALRWLDGQSSLADALRMAELEQGKSFAESEMEAALAALPALTQAGYLRAAP